MQFAPLILLLVCCTNIVLALISILTNPQRMQNRLFALFAVSLSTWPASVYAILSTDSPETAERFIRIASLTAPEFVLAFQLFCVAIVSQATRFRPVLWQCRYLIVATQLVGALAFTDWFMTGVRMPSAPGVDPFPIPIYGPAFPIVNGYAILSCLITIVYYFRRLPHLNQLPRAELQFTLLGFACCLCIATLTSLLIPLFAPGTLSEPFGPLAVIPMNIIILYGVATRRILDVPAFLQRMTAYIVLTLYLVTLYVIIDLGVARVLDLLGLHRDFVPHVLAALAIAFSMAPAHGLLQRMSNRLFISRNTLDVNEVSKRGSEIFASISTVDAILNRFLEILEHGGIDADPCHILLPERDEFVEWVPAVQPEPAVRLAIDPKNPLVRRISNVPAPVAAYSLRRSRPSPGNRSLGRALGRLHTDLAVGIFFKTRLCGLVLLGPRRSGRIYTSEEQDALQMLCNHLAVALENANLYTEVQNNKIYNDILVDSLLSGVVAVSSEGFITVFNKEAQRMTGISAGSALGRAVEVLPDALATVLRDTLNTGRPAHDLEAVLTVSKSIQTPIRYGSSLFYGANGQVIGALVVFSDQTARMKLEMQVRRSDRLASIGTLSAGMAHEIKNPLVTVKTFTELLPDRYHDEEFRETFSKLVGKEVQRIDGIVNQLLRFARPARPDLRHTSLHEIVHGAMPLMQEQLRRKDIQLSLDLSAEADTIRADPSLLEQAFINLLFNAVDSMDPNGLLMLSTGVGRLPWHLRRQHRVESDEEFIRLSIRDTGCGIATEDLATIFDPFYTTKEHGTGLGLPIAHGIVTDHGGLVDVESAVGTGTVFHMFFRLTRAETPVP